jgi:hypothetical protein
VSERLDDSGCLAVAIFHSHVQLGRRECLPILILCVIEKQYKSQMVPKSANTHLPLSRLLRSHWTGQNFCKISKIESDRNLCRAPCTQTPQIARLSTSVVNKNPSILNWQYDLVCMLFENQIKSFIFGVQ